ncbi:MAG: hypothetical protein ABIH83_04345 [Candidatus Micrarchaeota archaeon]
MAKAQAEVPHAPRAAQVKDVEKEAKQFQALKQSLAFASWELVGTGHDEGLVMKFSEYASARQAQTFLAVLG